ncbi:MAG: UvrD-helicase domain-containing protein [Pseudomonadota bacterium]
MNELERADDAARAAALDPARSLLLQAPAGSGKTTVLTQRFLRLLATVEEPEEILAITFTRKAAAEMRERVLDALGGKLPSQPATARLTAELRDAALRQATRRGWDLQELPARLRIQTIDSLNHELARSMPLLGRAAGALEVTDQAGPLYAQAARQTLLYAEEDPDYQADMDLLFRRLDNNWATAERLLAAMLQGRAQWLPPLLDGTEADLADWVEASLQGIVSDALAEAQRCILAQLVHEGVQIARAAAGHRADLAHEPDTWQIWLDPATTPGAEPSTLAAWSALADLALTRHERAWRRRVDVRDGFPPDQKDLKQRWSRWITSLAESTEAQRCLLSLRDLPPPWLGAEGRAALTALARLLKLAAAELTLQFQVAGRVDHSEVAAVARQALTSSGQPSDFALRHTAALRHLLVDEFQDTSIEQFGLLEALTVGWQAGDGRSLFLVGDPMQSIYQFRSAEVGLFLRAREQGIGDVPLESLQLTRNFRSQPAIVAWVNAGFGQVFPPRDDLRSSAVKFHPSTAARAETPLQLRGVSVRLLPDNSREEEAQQIAATIVAARAADPDTRIAILVLSRSHAPAILQALAAAGVATRGIDLAPLADQPAVEDVVSLARALLHAGDRSAWLSVLRAPWCGLSLGDLHRLAGDEAQQRLMPELLRDTQLHATLSVDGQTRLRRCAGLLVTAWDNRARADLATEAESLWLRLGGPAACVDEREYELAREFLEKLRALAANGEQLDTARVQALAQALKSGGAGEGGDAVDILTIHKAKGLEWDIVIVPGLNRATRQGDAPLLRWLELPRRRGGKDLLMAALTVGRPEGVEPLSRYIALLQKERDVNERARLAYVAATRAREQLHLFGHFALTARGEPRLQSGSLLRTVWPALKDEPAVTAALLAAQDAAAQATAALPTEQTAPPAALLARLPADWQLPTPPAPLQWHAIDVGADEPPPRPEFSWVGPGARALGTVVHGEFERLAAVPAAEAQLEQRMPAWRTWLRQLGLAAAEVEPAALRVLAILERTLNDPRARWILDPTHRDARSELRLSGLVRGRLRNVIVDRTFIDADGIRWIIDFKTSAHEGADLEGFLQQELERYRPQLEQYGALVARLGPEPVRAALYFPLLGEFRELPPGSLAAG